MAVTVESFLAKNTVFQGRRVPAIQGAIDEAALQFDAAVCGAMHDALIEAQTRVILLEDPNGIPTSGTGDKSNLLETAKARLLRLKRIVPLRGLGTRESC